MNTEKERTREERRQESTENTDRHIFATFFE